jgi:hypothetical protein
MGLSNLFTGPNGYIGKAIFVANKAGGESSFSNSGYLLRAYYGGSYPPATDYVVMQSKTPCIKFGPFKRSPSTILNLL